MYHYCISHRRVLQSHPACRKMLRSVPMAMGMSPRQAVVIWHCDHATRIAVSSLISPRLSAMCIRTEQETKFLSSNRCIYCPVKTIGHYLLIPAGLELEQLGVLPAGGYQLRVGALLYHPAFVQHEDAIG